MFDFKSASYFRTGMDLARKEEYGEVVFYFSKAISSEPNNPWYHAYKGEALIRSAFKEKESDQEPLDEEDLIKMKNPKLPLGVSSD
jgi:hypothetical protein